MKIITEDKAAISPKGVGMKIRYGFSDSPFGCCFLAVSGHGITHLAFPEMEQEKPMEFAVADWPQAEFLSDKKFITRAITDLFTSPAKQSLHVKGTDFQTKIWSSLINIPTGETSTYEKIAQSIGKPSASRAVGNAIGQNRISYLIPCHRVLRKDGSLGGYRWGTDVKNRILRSEVI